METTSALDMRERLGADRVIAPVGVLPQPAEKLDASGPVRPHEFEIAVERLCLDSTSFRNIRQHAGGTPGRMAARIRAIVGERGKMHNPETDSGGVALGTVTAVGERYTNPPRPGDRVVALMSLTLTPLRIHAITHVDPDSAQVEVEGIAYVCDRGPWGPLPGEDDIPLEPAVVLYDVYGAGSHTKEMTPAGGTVYVLGAGHAGKLAMAAAQDAGAGTVVAIDIDEHAVEAARELGLADIAVATDLRHPLAALGDVTARGAPPADLTVVAVNVTGCEPSAILLTADAGIVLFYSMATSFQTAALTADGMSSNVRMIVGNGYAPDAGAYALDLYRRSEPLRKALG